MQDTNIEDEWRHGGCYPMALALHRELGWPIECLVVDLPNRSHVVHAWVVDPEGRPFDAGGHFERDGLRDEFLSHSGHKWTKDRIESFPDDAAFMVRLQVAYGDAEDFRVSYLERYLPGQLARASDVVQTYVRPVHLGEIEQKTYR